MRTDRVGTLTGPPESLPYPVHTQPVEHVVLSADETENQKLQALLSINRQLTRQARKLYNYASPVEERAILTPGSPPETTINPDYDQLVKIESIMFSLPLGITSAILKIGAERQFPLYNGAALATQTLSVVQGIGMLVGPDDRRSLLLVGTPTTTGYISLMGHCFEREGDR